jgi:endonuclease-8
VPEGDTIHRAARTLESAIGGQLVTRFETVLAPLAAVDDQEPIAGRRIERVSAAGKHLLIEFSGDLVLRTHMRMNGSWHIYRPGERWQRRRSDMRIVIATEPWVAVGFNVPVAEFHTSRSLQRQTDLRAIGPDLLAADVDFAEGVRRMRERPGMEIANVLLNQRVVAGIGNVYKSEALFMEGINPFTLVGALTDDRLDQLLRTMQTIMRRNVDEGDGGRRTTGRLAADEGLWVYSRRGEPCRRCGTPIEYQKQGPDVRGTYWCPRCQPAG